MEAYRTEEEQLEALRRWWREQGRTTLLIIALAIAGVFGYRAWTQQQQDQLQQVAAIYQGLLSADQQLQDSATPELRQTARHLASSLREEHARTVYARFAALFQAKYAVQDGNIEVAEDALQWVIERKSGDALAQLATLRLANLHYAEGDYARTLEILDSGDAGSYAAAYESLRGDVLHAQGDVDGAAAAWRRSAEQAAGLAEPVRDPVLQLKLSNVSAAHGES